MSPLSVTYPVLPVSNTYMMDAGIALQLFVCCAAGRVRPLVSTTHLSQQHIACGDLHGLESLLVLVLV